MGSIAMSPERRKTYSIKFLGPVDITGLRDTILSIPEEVWALENQIKPNKFEALDATQHIVFRFVDKLTDWRQSHDRPLWPSWREHLEPVMRQATLPYGYARGLYPRVMLARMNPGGTILPHIDASPSASWPHKIHVPILTNPHVEFQIGPQRYHLEEGQAYEVNNLVTHSVANRGETPRIHLIFEYCEAPG